MPSVGESRREAHMRRAIRAVLKDGARCVAVVCGAWHVPAIDDAARAAVKVGTDAATLRGLPKVKVASAWVPWTHRRLTSRSGYGAGVDSPGWYHHVFDHPGADGVARFFVDTAHHLRDHGLPASPDHLIAGTRLADTLAALRDRPRPGLREVLDAADAVLGNVDLVLSEIVIGDALGAVPAEAPQVPLAKDLAKLQKSARLRPSAEIVTVEVDLRTPTGLRKSHLLHRLLALGVPWGVPEEGRGSSGTFRETWRLAWEPELSIRLVERAGYGTTVEAASTARLLESTAAATSLPELVGLLELALFADLPDAIEPSVRRLAERAAHDPDLGHLMDVAGPLASALRYGDVRATDASSLRAVFDGIVVRICAGLVPACDRLDDDAAAEMVERLTDVQTALAMLDHGARRRSFPNALVQLGHRHPHRHGLISGRATRLLHDAGIWTARQVDQRLGQALSGGATPAEGAAFVEGFLAGSGTVLLHDTELLDVVDRWLSSLTTDAFDAVLALLRRTFGGFEAAERRQLMALLTGGDLRRVTGFGSDVDPTRAADALRTVRHLLGLAVHTDTPLTPPSLSSVTSASESPTMPRPEPSSVPRAESASTARPGGSTTTWVELPQVSAAERRRRWRLVLGAAAETGVSDDQSAETGVSDDQSAETLSADGQSAEMVSADGHPFPDFDDSAPDVDGESSKSGNGPSVDDSVPGAGGRSSTPGGGRGGGRGDGIRRDDPAPGRGGESSRGGPGDLTGGEQRGPGEQGGQRGPGGQRAQGGRQGPVPLTGDDARIDAALGALYDRDERTGGPGRRSAGTRRGGLGRSKPGVVRWLGDIRRYFPSPVVQVLQRDAVERLDLQQLLLEPELLDSIEPDLGLVTVLVELNRVMPDETRATARHVITTVLARIEARLADQTRQAVRGALARGASTRRPRPGDVDWQRTIHANLRHWIPERRTLVPEQLVGHGRRQQSLAKDVVIAVDQSGSMAESVVYASLFAGVLAQLPTLRTTFVAFDTAITDLTPFLHDPVEVLFGVQLGGGTDIATALGYCQQRIERPRESVLVLISDLFEGGNGDVMRRRIGDLVTAGVRVIVLLALSDDGA
ncbi:MAG: DUF5682 family protein, partial [Actinomycetota bacterium]